ncbi:glycosyltransferase [Francisella noatunensis]|uniref:Glycosyltransferase n=1 Tax=Francisella noatunensis TaxID=657445 RepID=A0A9Q2KST3_9GAMM|nr:glycosyltransferase family 2 protein [Francisella noatunensis]MBK2028562.1 glycosyltransferase [Francisella noatunensis]MBK2034217.1 glycosyltransferase [Francisella noatunensis]MBK2048498.1 glycosyltransferase [Francisella noatunensis]MBK2050700.1 glycosyltransferase [Francisella noatunensis]MBK2051764.1 glycosyltransferase [Francisella noatunensis]
MKVSIITVCYNSAETIEKTIQSVISQSYQDIEYIIIDGGSYDGTLDILTKYRSKLSKVVSESDDGIYDAMNKGIALATGDIIGILNSDDCYSNSDVIESIVSAFKQNDKDMLFADLKFVNENNKILRYYSAKRFTPNRLKFGIMPPHPTLFVKKDIYQKYGVYRLDFKIAADYEIFVRFLLVNRLSYMYLNKCIINMLVGGVSTSNLQSKKIINQETMKALELNGINANYLCISTKYVTKILEILKGRLLNYYKKN